MNVMAYMPGFDKWDGDTVDSRKLPSFIAVQEASR